MVGPVVLQVQESGAARVTNAAARCSIIKMAEMRSGYNKITGHTQGRKHRRRVAIDVEDGGQKCWHK